MHRSTYSGSGRNKLMFQIAVGCPAYPNGETRAQPLFWLDACTGRWHNPAAIVQVSVPPGKPSGKHLVEDSRMKKWFLLSLLVCSTIAFGQAAASSAPQDLSTLDGRHEPPMLGIHWARGFDPFARLNEAHGGGGGKKSPNMTYHGGHIIPTSVTQAIFWGTSWSSPTFQAVKV